MTAHNCFPDYDNLKKKKRRRSRRETITTSRDRGMLVMVRTLRERRNETLLDTAYKYGARLKDHVSSPFGPTKLKSCKDVVVDID